VENQQLINTVLLVVSKINLLVRHPHAKQSREKGREDLKKEKKKWEKKMRISSIS
jgi:hypothetical protein